MPALEDLIVKANNIKDDSLQSAQPFINFLRQGLD
jgi:hypothetical protein